MRIAPIRVHIKFPGGISYVDGCSVSVHHNTSIPYFSRIYKIWQKHHFLVACDVLDLPFLCRLHNLETMAKLLYDSVMRSIWHEAGLYESRSTRRSYWKSVESLTRIESLCSTLCPRQIKIAEVTCLNEPQREETSCRTPSGEGRDISTLQSICGGDVAHIKGTAGTNGRHCRE